MADCRFALVLGGARSGKSTFASRLASRLGGRVLFVATATALDDEMRRRIAKHRMERPVEWVTLEAPTHLMQAVDGAVAPGDVVLVDCLTLGVFNLLYEIAGEGMDEGQFDDAAVREALQADLDGLISKCREAGAYLIVVSNEVGMGLVPPYPLGRSYRDLLGYANQYLARQADRVYYLFAGLPVELRALTAALDKGLVTD